MVYYRIIMTFCTKLLHAYMYIVFFVTVAILLLYKKQYLFIVVDVEFDIKIKKDL